MTTALRENFKLAEIVLFVIFIRLVISKQKSFPFLVKSSYEGVKIFILSGINEKCQLNGKNMAFLLNNEFIRHKSPKKQVQLLKNLDGVLRRLEVFPS